ncbi:MAG: LCP family protein [Bacilli bacterium]|nr:LCP family protein [Bacilli bacterium]
MKNNKKNINLKKYLFKGIAILCDILALVLLIVTFMLGVVPIKFSIIIAIVLVLLSALVTYLLFKKGKKKTKIIGTVISILLIIVYSFALVYESKTIGFFDLITGKKNAVENYLVIVKNNSNYNDIKDIKDTKMGIINSSEGSYKQALDKLNDVIKLEHVTYEDYSSLADALFSDEIVSFLIEESQEAILEENYEDFTDNTKVIYSFTVESTLEDIRKDTDVTKNSFNIFISGIDTYGSINSVSRSDVNIVVTLNPDTGKMSMVHIPRDYYVKLYNKNGYNDKLTHAGIYGIETSVKTIENLLDIDINYYVKFNFTSVIKIVDKLGGVRVYSDQAFNSGKYDRNTKEVYHYNQGYNELNGKQALSFARERKKLAGGDRARGVHQEALIEAILDKITSPSIIVNYTSLLDALSETFVTNMDSESLKKLINLQIDKNIKWKSTSMVMNGQSASELTYSYPRQKLYVMIPSNDSINEAKKQISTIYNE